MWLSEKTSFYNRRQQYTIQVHQRHPPWLTGAKFSGVVDRILTVLHHFDTNCIDAVLVLHT